MNIKRAGRALALAILLTPVRTSGTLGIGHYWAVVDFRVNYD
ncbi:MULTISPECIES: hypothetical protein [Photorhabdus]|nr:hypothetical protein [Photorhabdus thracensis]